MITPVATELTTAATDLVLGVVSFVLLVLLHRTPVRDAQKRRFWSWMFVLLGTASLLGTVAHGFVLPDLFVKGIWHALYLLLGFTVGFFAIGAIHELWGARISRKVLPYILAASLSFYLVTIFTPGSFLVFIVYEALALAGALTIYIYLGVRERLKAHFLMVAGIAFSILAAVIQASGRMRMTFVWDFDHNGIFHLVQIVGIILIYRSLRVSLSIHQ